MVSKTSRSIALGLGIVSTLALATVPAKAQIPITGGNVSGNAAYFVPQDTDKGIRPFDLQVQGLTIVSPNGTLTNPAFVPTALGGYTDMDGNNQVTSGDMGLIRGRLSGIGFDSFGIMIPFSQVDTILGYQIGSFVPENTLNGTLLNIPGVSQYFLANFTYKGTPNNVLIGGHMEVGALNGDLKTGLIALPSNIQFIGSSGGSLIPSTFDLAQKITFKFEGDGAKFNTLTHETDQYGSELRFFGETKQFEIKTVGGGSVSFELSDSGGIVDFQATNRTAVGAPKLIPAGNLTSSETIDYEIEGQGTGIFGFLSSAGAVFVGENASGDQPTTYWFKENDGTLIKKGEIRGDIAFALGVGQTFDSSLTVNTGTAFTFNEVQTNVVSTANLSSSSRNITTNLINIDNVINIGGFSFNFTDGKIDLSSIFDANGNVLESALETEEIRRERFFKALVDSILDDVQFSGSIAAFSTDRDAGTYELLGSPLYSFAFSPGRRGRGKIKVRLVQRGGDRYVLALRGGGRGRRGLGIAVGGVKFIGPTSRVFPTLVGTVDLTPEQIQSVYEELNAEESDPDDPLLLTRNNQGLNQFTPILPIAQGQRRINGNFIRTTFSFVRVPSGRWCDPPPAPTYTYEMDSEDSLFAGISGFPTGIDRDNRFTVSVNGLAIGEFSPGETIRFSDHADVLGDALIEGAGVKQFSIGDIDADDLDPTDPEAFPVKLDFTTPTADFTMVSPVIQG